jgi:uncharacterized protein (DUF58 family)
VTVAVDLGRAAVVGEGIDTAAEDVIRIAGSVARYALAQRHTVQLALCGESLAWVGPLRGIAGLDSALRALALAHCDGTRTFGSHMPQVMARVPQNSTAVLVYADANAGSLTAISALKQKAVMVVPVVVETGSYAGDIEPPATKPAKGRRLRRARRGAQFAAMFRQ